MNIAKRVSQIRKSAIHEMTRLSKQYEDVAFLSWAKPTSGTPEHINEAAIAAIKNGLTGGYSQSEGLPELREEMVNQIKKAHIPFSICAPVVSQYAAIAALKGPQDCVEEFRHHYLKARNLMCERLDRLNSVFEYNKPGGSYLMFPRLLNYQKRWRD